jgi:soluble P-type ATPase
MITIRRAGQEPLEMEFILIDLEGTLAQDRRIHPKAKDKMNLLSKRAKIYIMSKEKNEGVALALEKVKAEVIYFTEGDTAQRKLNLLRQLGTTRTVAIGNGMDDILILEEASLGICVIGREGAAGAAIRQADLLFADVVEALDFLLKPLRQEATLGL